MLARKDFFVRYRRAAFGVVWAVAMPAIQAVVLAVVLSRVTKFDVPHYPVFIFSGIVAWSYFSTSLASGATSIVDNAALSSKIYFPRAVLPIAVCTSALFTLGVSVVVLLVVQLASGAGIGLHALWLAPATVLAVVLVLSLTITLSAAQVYLRDIKYAVQASLLVWFYITPIFYPLELLHGVLRDVVLLNPMTGVVQLFHLATVGGSTDVAIAAVVSVGWTVAFVLAGITLHCRFDRFVADLM